MALAADRCTRLFDEERDKRERCDAVEPPPTEQSRRCQADHQNDRQITARDRFDRVASKRGGIKWSSNFQFITGKKRHAAFSPHAEENAPDTLVCVGNPLGNKQAVTGIKKNVSN